MKKIISALIISLMLVIMVGSVSAQSNQDNQATVEGHLMRYIDAINLRDYATAYAMLEAPQQSYQNFVTGYAQTQRIIPYFGRVGAAAGSLYVTSVLLGYQTDGTVESYYGYFKLSHGANYVPQREGYVMTGSQFQLLRDGIALHNSTIQTLLNAEWTENPAVPLLSSLSEMSDYPAEVMLEYYDLINAQNYGTAYAQWLNRATHGLTADYRLPYQQFVTGYGDTAYVTVYAGAFQPIPLAQQRGYLSTYLPVILVGHHNDDNFVTYSGCYALGNLGVNQLGIVNGKFQLLFNGAPNAATIFNTLDQLDCATLGMGL
jgi:hypothetical protein